MPRKLRKKRNKIKIDFLEKYKGLYLALIDQEEMTYDDFNDLSYESAYMNELKPYLPYNCLNLNPLT